MRQRRRPLRDLRRTFVARFEARLGQRARLLVRDKSFADRLLVAARLFALPGVAAPFEHGVQRLEGETLAISGS
jgi:hypothetical protein